MTMAERDAGGEAGCDAGFFVRWLGRVASTVEREADRLTELDAAIGDADHGDNLRRGFDAVRATLDQDPPVTPGAVLLQAGRTLVATVGGASGPLYGTLLRGAGKALGTAEWVGRAELAEALVAGGEAVARLGSAAAGDKTMLDALLPAVDALPGSWEAARTAATEGARGTVPMRARRGRASYLGERSVGHQDPGATSLALLFDALAEERAEEGGRR